MQYEFYRNMSGEVTRDFQKYTIRFDEELRCNKETLDAILDGRETLSIRFAQNRVRVPKMRILPLILTEEKRVLAGWVDLDFVYISAVKDFPLSLIRRDVYQTRKEMIADISSIYDYTLQPDDIISGYAIRNICLNESFPLPNQQ